MDRCINPITGGRICKILLFLYKEERENNGTNAASVAKGKADRIKGFFFEKRIHAMGSDWEKDGLLSSVKVMAFCCMYCTVLYVRSMSSRMHSRLI